MGGEGGRPASGSLVHLTDLGRAPEEMVVVRGQEGMSTTQVTLTSRLVTAHFMVVT